MNISQSVTVNGGAASRAAPAVPLLALVVCAAALVFVGVSAILTALAWLAGGLAALALAAAVLLWSIRRHREAFRPIGPAPVVDGAVQVQISTGPATIAGRRCNLCPGVPAVAVLVSAAGDIAPVCAAHLAAARLRLSSIPIVSSSREIAR